MAQTQVKPKAHEFSLAPNGDAMFHHRAAVSAGLTLSQYLEREMPESDYKDGLDAFERQLQRYGILTRSLPGKGIWASKMEAFFISEDPAATPILFPEFVNRVARQALIQDDILMEMVAIQTPIDTNAYRTIYLDNDTYLASKKRVAEGADMPVATMKTSENTIKLYKYGRKVKATYEAMRRMRLDLFALQIQGIMKQAAMDRATDAYGVLKNGDGNNNVATNYNKTALQTGLATAALTYSGWLKYMFNFYPHKMTTIIGGIDDLIELLTMDAPNIDPLKLIEMLRFGNASQTGTMAQNIMNNYRIVYLPDATAHVLLGFDKQFGLEMVTEIGSDLMETQKLISNQWQEIVISEVNGFGIFLPLSRRTLTLNA